jgi:hypothetical protein
MSAFSNIYKAMMTIIIVIGIVICAILAIVFVRSNKNSSPKSAAQHSAEYIERMADAKLRAEQIGDKEAVQAILEDRYDELVQQRALKKRASTMPTKRECAVVAVAHGFNISGINYRKNIAKYVGTFEGYLTPEPTNQFDKNAIAIFHNDGHHLGYIPADSTDDIRYLGMKFPIMIYGEIGCDYDGSHRYFHGTVYIKNIRI